MNAVSCAKFRTVIVRITKEIIALRSPQGASKKSLAVDLEVCEKTIQRDFDMMRDQLGMGLVYSPTKFTWSIDGAQHAPWLKELL